MANFVSERSIVRQIWGKSDTVLFIFAGAAAEFALNKAVDWLYFTGKLPADPLGRLFSTVSYARAIIFSKEDDALRAIDTIAAIHKGVEEKRGARIPDWAYRDVLFMLVDYSIRSFELLERKLSHSEKAEAFNVFKRVGERMGLEGMPRSFEAWENMRQVHLHEDLQHSRFTDDLFEQYRKHLGRLRYILMRGVQTQLVPSYVRGLLGMGNVSFLLPVLWFYKSCRNLAAGRFLKGLILPKAFKAQILALDRN
jgi:hypothetical protein